MMSSNNLQSILRKVLAGLLAAVVAMILLGALVIGGVTLLLYALILELTPWVGEAGAFGIAGFLCVLAVALVFWRLLRTPKPGSAAEPRGTGHAADLPGSAFENYRQIVRKNPWEAIVLSFSLGLAQKGDPRLRELLMENAMDFLRGTDKAASAQSRATEDTKPAGSTTMPPPEPPPAQ